MVFKLRKAMNVSFVMLPILVFTIGIPLFYFTYTAKDINNTKKMLQEAAYAGALAGTYAVDIENFQNGTEAGRSTTKESYPLEKDSKQPASFMKQSTMQVRKGTSPVNSNDCLGGARGNTYTANDLAAKEVIAAVEEYLDKNLNKTENGSKPVYSESDYTIAISFSREGLINPSGVSVDGGGAPYNKVTVSVVLNYKPTLLRNLAIMKDTFKDDIPIYGTSSAKTKTIG